MVVSEPERVVKSRIRHHNSPVGEANLVGLDVKSSSLRGEHEAAGAGILDCRLCAQTAFCSLLNGVSHRRHEVGTALSWCDLLLKVDIGLSSWLISWEFPLQIGCRCYVYIAADDGSGDLG